MADRNITVHLDQPSHGHSLKLIAEVLQFLVDNRRNIPQSTIQAKVDELKQIAFDLGAR